jgi:hypothetical protein
MIVGQKELINLVCFLKDKIRINMDILVFKGSKGEAFEVFLKEYKRACIDMGFITTTNWLNFFLEFLEGTTSHWFER